MVLDEVLRMNQNTIGVDDLASFVTALDDVATRCSQQPSEELGQATTTLRAALAQWEQSLRGHDPVDYTTAPTPGTIAPTVDGVTTEVAVLRTIEQHLDRLVLRHSNFGLAAANVPSSLDDLFPERALTYVRTALPHLRAAKTLLSDAT